MLLPFSLTAVSSGNLYGWEFDPKLNGGKSLAIGNASLSEDQFYAKRASLGLTSESKLCAWRRCQIYAVIHTKARRVTRRLNRSF